MKILTGVFFVYALIAFYFSFLFLLIYLQNRKEFFSSPKMTISRSLSIIIPCYNEEETIGEAIENLLNSSYKGLKKIIAVDDCSTDNSFKILKELEKKYEKLLVVQTPKNAGCAAGSKNYGVKFAKTELIGFIDADSFPKRSAIERMIGFFDDPKIAAVTSFILVKNRGNLLTRLQSIEYQIIAFTRRLLGFIGAIYVTPGPLAIYRKSYFDELNGFDEKNLTEDIEITWNFVSKGYAIAMSPNSRVYTVVPSRISEWFKQRIRWNVGGIQTIFKYKYFFLKEGMLGRFILPLFVSSWILALAGFFILAYRISRTAIIRILATKYSIGAQTAIIAIKDLQISPNVLMLFGAINLLLGMIFTFFALMHSREDFKKERLHEVLIYAFFYLLTYPIIMIRSVYGCIKRKKSW